MLDVPAKKIGTEQSPVLIPLVFEGLPLLVTLVWVAAMEVTDENPCWEDYDTNHCIFIIVIPMLSILLVPALATKYPISYK